MVVGERLGPPLAQVSCYDPSFQGIVYILLYLLLKLIVFLLTFVGKIFFGQVKLCIQKRIQQCSRA